jgi:hypothetical protein
MESIYVISTIKKAAKNIYKVGRHTGTNRSLDSRYTTSLQNPVTFYFKPVDNGTVCIIEKIIKEKLLPYRITNLNGSTLEWVNLELEKIVTVIANVIKEFQKNQRSNKHDKVLKNKKTITTKKTIKIVYDNSSDTDSEDNKKIFHIKRKVNNGSSSNSESNDIQVNDPSTTEESNVCKKCGLSFNSQSTFNYHVLRRKTDCTKKIHGNVGKTRNGPNIQVKYICEICDPSKEFTYNKYNRHLGTTKHQKNAKIYENNL